MFLGETLAVAAVAVEHHAVAAHPVDVLLGDGCTDIVHVHVQEVVGVLQVDKVVFTVDFTAGRTEGWRCEGEEEGEGEEKRGDGGEAHS